MKILVDEETGQRYQVEGGVKSLYYSENTICAYITPIPASRDEHYQLEMDKWAKYSEGWCP